MRTVRDKIEEQVWTSCLLTIADAGKPQGVGVELVEAGYQLKKEVRRQLAPVMTATLRSSDEETRT